MLGNKKQMREQTMSNVLFVKINDRPEDQAISVQMYNKFLNTFKETTPNEEIIELDLFNANLPYYGNSAIAGGFKRSKGLELTAEEAKATDIVEHYLKQFLDAEKIVFAFPLWYYTVPAPLITYVSYLSQARKTQVSNKKVAILCARGSDYSSEHMASKEMGVNFVTNWLHYRGITELETVVIEGHTQYPGLSQGIIEDGLEMVVKVASHF
ncbi:FMN-dependent NADH-azoreductase [Peribacillus muralis]|uniref:FMN-dependent NADH-azoreductase n=1 Tax=Peribacillus muralis TaxID=264697 RepID=A0A1B3XN44_9BACI|nr:FMN-dependent NADH-azoreductase [Peribacillus muralis]AOH54633.1 FMN-dependent NADH-azoreductase [Peribacillus muralis]